MADQRSHCANVTAWSQGYGQELSEQSLHWVLICKSLGCFPQSWWHRHCATKILHHTFQYHFSTDCENRCCIHMCYWIDCNIFMSVQLSKSYTIFVYSHFKHYSRLRLKHILAIIHSLTGNVADLHSQNAHLGHWLLKRKDWKCTRYSISDFACNTSYWYRWPIAFWLTFWKLCYWFLHKSRKSNFSVDSKSCVC